ncbi:hypothetical protein TKK_0001004 [Trichogramma kaykai]|uniref:Bardet-Biedl syndrome 7 protein homolog n=1 Tax=Trichogramma kaykai TaxID=54128 RepID=A0ABD2WRT7_9HYME
MLQTLQLTRVDYASVGVTSRATTLLLPPSEAAVGKPNTQSFVVGDHDGVLHVYGQKRGELQVLFKSLPGPKISRLSLGGASVPKDKIFLAHGNTVMGYTRKGKVFLEFDTSLMEPISAMSILGSDLAACARDLYHRYRDCKDADSYLAGEKLLDVVLLPAGPNVVIAILACADCAIRVLHSTKSPAVLRLPSVPTVLTPYRDEDKESYEHVLMGTMDGKVGLLMLDKEKNIRVSWLLNKAASEVRSLDSFKIDDSVDLIIGRQDGSIEIFTFPTEDDPIPMRRFQYSAGESISCVLGGRISSADFPELLVTTYSGKIFGLTSQPVDQNQHGDAALVKLQAELQQLADELKKEPTGSPFFGDNLKPLVLSLNHRLALNQEDASYTFFLELDRSIDNVLVQSDTPLELIDSENNNAVLSLSSCNPSEGNYVLATYRCQDNTNRLEIKFRSIEGQPGTLRVYVTSQLQPKCCRRIQVHLCALSLHARIHANDQEPRDEHIGPFNELRLTGGFSMAEMHAWLALSLPEVPERPSIKAEEAEASLLYRSTAVGTIVKCRYRKGVANFQSENITSIILLRDILTKEATKRKIKLEVYFDVSEASMSRVIELIYPKLTQAKTLLERIKCLDALEEWEMKNNPKELCTEYQYIINDETELRAKYKNDPHALKRLQGIVVDLYVDWERAKGSRRISNKQAEEKLQDALESMELSALLRAFVIKDTGLISAPVLLQ